MAIRHWEGGKNMQNTDDFYYNENIPYNTKMMNTCHYTFFQTHRMYNINSEQ